PSWRVPLWESSTHAWPCCSTSTAISCWLLRRTVRVGSIPALILVWLVFSYTQEKMLNSSCYWLGTSHSGQSTHCHMQLLIPTNLAYGLLLTNTEQCSPPNTSMA